MPKTKPKTKTPAALSVIDLTADLDRSEDGFGALPGIDIDEDFLMTSEQRARLEAQLDQLGVPWRFISLRDQAAKDPAAAGVLAEFERSDVVHAWHPTVADEEGWQLLAVVCPLAVAHDPQDVLAVMARTAAPAPEASTTDAAQAAADPVQTEARVRMFLVGNLMRACKRRFMDLAQPWRQLSEVEQSRVLERLAEDVRTAVAEATRAIASNERLTFRAEVESVNFKGSHDVKATLKLVASNEAHALADVAGGFVTIVIENQEELLAIPEGATAGEPDNLALFDASTAGTALDTKPESAEV